MATDDARPSLPDAIDGAGLRIGIVRARWNAAIVDRLVEGARRGLRATGVSDDAVVELSVPGSFEVPFGAKVLAESGRVDAVVCLGTVIRGETSHYDYVCAESARKLQDLACEHTLALGYGILTCETRDQAWERARPEGKDRGGAAARTCLAMLELKRRFHLFPR